jgi:hypothetical protein
LDFPPFLSIETRNASISLSLFFITASLFINTIFNGDLANKYTVISNIVVVNK